VSVWERPPRDIKELVCPKHHVAIIARTHDVIHRTYSEIVKKSKGASQRVGKSSGISTQRTNIKATLHNMDYGRACQISGNGCQCRYGQQRYERRQKPRDGFLVVASARRRLRGRKVASHVVNGALHDVQLVTEILQRFTRHDEVGFVETMSLRSFPCFEVTLSAASFAVSKRPAGFRRFR
jgi:hypothetical protein